MARSLKEIEASFLEEQKRQLEEGQKRKAKKKSRKGLKEKHKKNTKLDKVLLVLFFIIGMAIFIYPSVSDYVARRNVIQGASTYKREISSLSKAERDKLLKEAEEYNASLGSEKVEDPFVPGSGRAISANYNKVMNTKDGIIGYVDIPRLKIYLPIRHGSEEDVLTKGAGHVEQTHFPIGGEGNLSVITAHTGFTGADMFNRLIEMKLKDTFMIHVLDETLTYEVDDISVIDPEDIEKLLPVQGKDYVTLLTCTPYGVNSHRLIVRGHRIVNAPREVKTVQEVPFPWRLVIMCGMAILMFTLIIIWNWYRRRGNRNKKEILKKGK
jgi:LPXTG-site transpeptidase (sortase) family protein